VYVYRPALAPSTGASVAEMVGSNRSKGLSCADLAREVGSGWRPIEHSRLVWIGKSNATAKFCDCVLRVTGQVSARAWPYPETGRAAPPLRRSEGNSELPDLQTVLKQEPCGPWFPGTQVFLDDDAIPF